MLKNTYIVLIVLGNMGIMAFAGNFDKVDKQEKNINNEAIYEPVVVLELFTSQGCSSCPSADILLQKVKKEYPDEVFGLSYHVDYWNNIGWKYPFSKAKFAEKQGQYNIKFRYRSNYTLQLVVNGKEHFVGSNSSKMYGKTNTYKEKKVTNYVVLNEVSVNQQNVSFAYEVMGARKQNHTDFTGS